MLCIFPPRFSTKKVFRFKILSAPFACKNTTSCLSILPKKNQRHKAETRNHKIAESIAIAVIFRADRPQKL